MFKKIMGGGKKDESDGVMRTPMGAPVANDNQSMTAGDVYGKRELGPVVMDHELLTKLAHFDRERIPERVVHAKGGGAYGYFEVTHDVSKYTKACVFQPKEKTEVFTRFSTVAGKAGSNDLNRDPRGFAIKHYTKDGIYDMVGNNIPIFFIRDPRKFPDFIHSQKTNPKTNRNDPNSVWDFWTLTHEAIHCATMIMSDNGLPQSWRHMNGYSSHTYKWVNAEGQAWWVKYHYKTNQKRAHLTDEEAGWKAMHEGMDCHLADLQSSIDKKEFPSWSMKVQLMPVGDEQKYKWNAFDLTKVWPHADYPLIDVGQLVLNRNPENYFAETEQVAFSPSHLIPGVEPSPCPMLQGRLFSYPDTHRHRLGVNYHQIPVNRPRCPFASYSRDGGMRVDGNGGSGCNYFPNSMGAPKPNLCHSETKVGTQLGKCVARFPVKVTDDDYAQCRALWLKVFDDAQRARTAGNIARHLSGGATDDIKSRTLELLGKVHPTYAEAVKKALGEVAQERLPPPSKMSSELKTTKGELASVQQDLATLTTQLKKAQMLLADKGLSID